MVLKTLGLAAMVIEFQGKEVEGRVWMGAVFGGEGWRVRLVRMAVSLAPRMSGLIAESERLVLNLGVLRSLRAGRSVIPARLVFRDVDGRRDCSSC